jgi:hypothetical protein
MFKFNQICNNILKETSLASHPGGVFGDGPGSIVNDPNVLMAMAISGSNTNRKKRKKTFKRGLNKTL